jgi:hypothetical protein
MINSVSQSKKYIFDDDTSKEYTPFIVNRSLSAFQDILIHVEAMNTCHFLNKKMQYDYYFYSIPSRKRFKPWLKSSKKEDDKYIERLAELNALSLHKAQDVWSLMNDDQKQRFVKLYVDLDKNKKMR